jgi:uncharacterized membrane protein YfcA
MRRLAVWLFVVYAAWSVVAVVEIVLRHHYAHSPLPGFLADHNGNIAVSGFIMAAAFPGAALARLAQRLDSRVLAMAGNACVPLAAVCWGVFFVLMEMLPLYSRNVIDWQDIPGSVVGLLCGAFFGVLLQRQLAQPTRRRAVRDAARGR